MHVPLRRGQVLVPRQFLDRPGWCSLHRQVRAERVAQDVNTWFYLLYSAKTQAAIGSSV
jgi:hypothetical protein